MKPIYSHLAAAFALSVSLASAACAQEFDPSIEAENSDDWLHAPITPGEFEYHDEGAESLALFGDANPVHLFVLRCDKASGGIGIARRGEVEGEILAKLAAAVTARTGSGGVVQRRDVRAVAEARQQKAERRAAVRKHTAPNADEFPIVIVGVSTGGPRIVESILSDLDRDFPGAVSSPSTCPAPSPARSRGG